MINIGGNMGEISVGNISIGSAYVGNQLVWEKTPAVLPYDAQVEWLGASGSQYISSGVLFQVGLKIYVDAMCTGNYSTTQIIAGPSGSGGLWVGNVSRNSGSWGIGSNANQVIGRSNVRTSMMLRYASGTTYLTGNGLTRNISRSSNPTEYPINFFCGNKNYYSTARLYSAKITDNNDVVLVDFIPVRKDGVGYMYDKISKELYGNAGSGSFTYGDDVT